ncbi:hypothetical protein I6B53_01285 [Schaalia sp. 19OD2882]|uniref:hypothetical protein n=1 Tax=Schaalia sp. 19OD2882 TaxID=2794089 RepID=UPI001C1F166D|nr:hypothetical protein [Schaalia sp. 19OD2882]QWW19796.1 hypothetical protein I6B53_01285 [Schaalia sp. 19OD2882]
MGLPWIEIVECLDPGPQPVLWCHPDPDGRIKSGVQSVVRENRGALLLSRGAASGVHCAGTRHIPAVDLVEHMRRRAAAAAKDRSMAGAACARPDPSGPGGAGRAEESRGRATGSSRM